MNFIGPQDFLIFAGTFYYCYIYAVCKWGMGMCLRFCMLRWKGVWLRKTHARGLPLDLRSLMTQNLHHKQSVNVWLYRVIFQSQTRRAFVNNLLTLFFKVKLVGPFVKNLLTNLARERQTRISNWPPKWSLIKCITSDGTHCRVRANEHILQEICNVTNRNNSFSHQLL